MQTLTLYRPFESQLPNLSHAHTFLINAATHDPFIHRENTASNLAPHLHNQKVTKRTFIYAKHLLIYTTNLSTPDLIPPPPSSLTLI